MKILRLFAAVAGSRTVSRERGPIAVIPLGGYSNWPLIEPFAWMKEHLLQDAVRMFVVLDRDYRTAEEVKDVLAAMSAIDVTAHVWMRKELESYVLVPSAIARVSGLSVAECERLLDESLAEQAQNVEANIFSHISKRSRGVDSKNLFEKARKRFAEVWTDRDGMIRSAPPKDVISALNSKIRRVGGSTVSAWKVARAMQGDELDDEIRELMSDVEHAMAKR